MVKRFDYELISAIDFSPTGKYLIVIQKPSVQFNLKLINVETQDFSLVYFFLIKKEIFFSFYYSSQSIMATNKIFKK